MPKQVHRGWPKKKPRSKKNREKLKQVWAERKRVLAEAAPSSEWVAVKMTNEDVRTLTALATANNLTASEYLQAVIHENTRTLPSQLLHALETIGND